MDAQFRRIEAILGPGEDRDFDEDVRTFYDYLSRELKLPCEVTGIEDFGWEEPYVFGGLNPKDYERLKKFQPSYRDRYDLLVLELGGYSEWMLFGDDIMAHVRRKSDGREFWLGLSELKAVSEKSPHARLLHDYTVFFVNSR